MRYTRREFGKVAFSIVPAVGITMAGLTGEAAPSKVDSDIDGVRVGMNVPYNFADMSMGGDEILARCVELDVSTVELRSQPVELFLGRPVTPALERGRRGAPITPDEQAHRQATADELRKWRSSVSMDQVKPFRRKYEDSGVMIQIVKFDGLETQSDEEIDYSFNLAKSLGGDALSCEISLPLAKRLAPFAEKHKLRVGFHGHTQATPAMFEEVMSDGTYNCANLDLGHFLVGNKTSPVPFLREHHDRITHVHIKDRKYDGATVPFGEGDVPIVEVLHLIRDNKWPIPAVIEFEYPIPAGSDRMSELAKCMKYCVTALRS